MNGSLSGSLPPTARGDRIQQLHAIPCADVFAARFGRRSGSILATGHDGGIVSLWDVSKGKCIKSFTAHQSPYPVKALDLDPQGEDVLLTGVAAGGSPSDTARQGEIRVWDLESEGVVRTFQSPLCPLDRRPTGCDALRYHPSDDLFLSLHSAFLDVAQSSTQLCVWDIRQNRNVFTLPLAGGRGPAHRAGSHGLPGLQSPITAAEWTPDGRWIVLGLTDGSVQIYDLSMPSAPVLMNTLAAAADFGPVRNLSIHPLERLVSATHSFGRMVFWNLETGQHAGRPGLLSGSVLPAGRGGPVTAARAASLSQSHLSGLEEITAQACFIPCAGRAALVATADALEVISWNPYTPCDLAEDPWLRGPVRVASAYGHLAPAEGQLTLGQSVASVHSSGPGASLPGATLFDMASFFGTEYSLAAVVDRAPGPIDDRDHLVSSSTSRLCLFSVDLAQFRPFANRLLHPTNDRAPEISRDLRAPDDVSAGPEEAPAAMGPAFSLRRSRPSFGAPASQSLNEPPAKRRMPPSEPEPRPGPPAGPRPVSLGEARVAATAIAEPQPLLSSGLSRGSLFSSRLQRLHRAEPVSTVATAPPACVPPPEVPRSAGSPAPGLAAPAGAPIPTSGAVAHLTTIDLSMDSTVTGSPVSPSSTASWSSSRREPVDKPPASTSVPPSMSLSSVEPLPPARRPGSLPGVPAGRVSLSEGPAWRQSSTPMGTMAPASAVASPPPAAAPTPASARARRPILKSDSRVRAADLVRGSMAASLLAPAQVASRERLEPLLRDPSDARVSAVLRDVFGAEGECTRSLLSGRLNIFSSLSSSTPLGELPEALLRAAAGSPDYGMAYDALGSVVDGREAATLLADVPGHGGPADDRASQLRVSADHLRGRLDGCEISSFAMAFRR
ncbi:hypothetical protein H696_04999 [Fonticula alba]|uniref:Uncharacterized protein n=1 Tax=Fonticula alba TaxID=691883 RepID=A0A058Z3J4_FONAL|nr:hypothetical protein H696_04999 [Fonticula alba]KCV68711.1 hypothetical protein H696_04999 [Fonticula alba]|eukprot:XP_009497143.1 hypothetical protein H696_04999 [Fonticula alba]